MTVITVTVNDLNGLGGRAPVVGPAYLDIRPERAWFDGGGVLTTRVQSVALLAGAASINVEPTSPGQAYRVGLRGVPGITRSWVLIVPDLLEISLVALVNGYQVDPASLPPAAVPDPAWTVEVDALVERMVLFEAATGITPGLGGIEHVQSEPAATWIIAVPEGLGRRPTVAIYDPSGEETGADVQASSTSVTITFSVPFAGSAVLS